MMDDKKKVELTDEDLENVTGGMAGGPSPCQIADEQLGYDGSAPTSYQPE